MPGNISIKQIVNATLKGIESSQKKYESWTGGWWLWAGPEYLITINVAEQLSKLAGPKFITLEHSSRLALDYAGAKGKGRLPRDVREHGKVDILLWWASDAPRAVIEIKNQIYYKEQYFKDIKRIKEFLKRNSEDSSLQFGLFAFYDSADDGKRQRADEKIVGKTNRIETRVKDILGSEFSVDMNTSKMHREGNSAWRTCCILIRLKKT